MKDDTKKRRIKILKTIGALVAAVLLLGYFFLQYVPKKNAQDLLITFESAVRSNQRDVLFGIVSKETNYYEMIQKDGWQEVFNKFHEGIEIYSLKYMPISLISTQSDIIIAEGKMKAVKDGKYRKYFQISLVKEKGEWKIDSFYFPDFNDY